MCLSVQYVSVCVYACHKHVSVHELMPVHLQAHTSIFYGTWKEGPERTLARKSLKENWQKYN